MSDENLSRFQQERDTVNSSKPVKSSRRKKGHRTPPRQEPSVPLVFEHARVYQTPLGLMIVEASP